MNKNDWEWIKEGYFRRLKVPWGWIVERFEDVCHDTGQGLQTGWDFRTSLCFMFDPFHQWKIDKERKG